MQDFDIGVLTCGQGKGFAYNMVNIGNPANNKVNLKMDADTTGWTNQNHYLGGRYGHNSAKLGNTAGARQIWLVTALPNNNTWQTASLEGDVAEFRIDAAGSNNVFDNCRYEVTGGARVGWHAAAIVQTVLAGGIRNQRNSAAAITILAAGAGTLDRLLCPGRRECDKVQTTPTPSTASSWITSTGASTWARPPPRRQCTSHSRQRQA